MTSPASATATSDPVTRAAHWRGRAHYVIFDSAFGDGERFAATLAAWHTDPDRSHSLHYIALSEGALPGFRRMQSPASGVTLDLLHVSLEQALGQLDARIDAFELHAMDGAGSGFARALARLAEPGALLHGEGLSLTQAHALSGAGFACHSPAPRRLEGSFTTRKPPSPWARAGEPERRTVVIGAGLAGAAACERLCARGWRVTLVERHAEAASEASGNLAGIFMPLLSKDDSIMARLSRAAFLYALDYWHSLGGLGPGGAIEGAACGVLQLARDAGHAEVQRAVAASLHYPREFAEWIEQPAASALLGRATPHGAWLFRQAGWARPGSVCQAMLAACGEALVRRFGVGSVTVGRHQGQWQVIDSVGACIAQAPVLIMANGVGALELAQSAALPLAAVRGQVTHVEAGELPSLPFVLCREAYLTPAIGGLHSLGASYDDDSDPALSAASQQENFDKIRSLLGDGAIGHAAPLQGRVGFRCVAPDRLPLVGALPLADAGGRMERLRDVPRYPGLYGLLGYASRGLAWAPLAAELLAARLDGEPLPLESDLAGALDPARFVLRARRQGSRAGSSNTD
ncbi:MAG: FAD-dependent 5-carboxymethylaminomethyl-2-thiouridine(34) oxidoreductase MnmC [Pseudomonadota bacterium]